MRLKRIDLLNLTGRQLAVFGAVFAVMLGGLFAYSELSNDTSRPTAYTFVPPATPATSLPISEPTPSATPSTSPSTPQPILGSPRREKICGLGFCAIFPTSGGEYDLLRLRDGHGANDHHAMLLVDHETGRVCPGSDDGTRTDKRCRKFVAEAYVVSVESAPDKGKALAHAKFKMTEHPGIFTGVRTHTFQGHSAVLGNFHTSQGGSGPYIYVWRSGLLYQISANSIDVGDGKPLPERAPAMFRQDFINWFRFTPIPRPSASLR